MAAPPAGAWAHCINNHACHALIKPFYHSCTGQTVVRFAMLACCLLSQILLRSQQPSIPLLLQLFQL